ncbi:CrcB family protein [Sanguibacter sp. HDW7]|uniref:fluoride efflux transporter FluC n=1 Tax=Sanguibacter sp. HDW7 TaxID=2714931 RepID=UPI0014099514|nr:CrcB family protein [Sanguibacter sp. HDW7]QIK82351.1 CrcB family protein [Sanguibacter sp. HDW7]
MIVLLFLLGGVGAAARFWVDGAIRARHPGPMPVATMSINVAGSLLIGVLLGLQLGGVLAPDGFAMLATGFCGGFTTFSTAMVEAVRLLQDGDVRRAWGSVALTLVLSVAAASLGVAVTAALA